MADKTKNYEPDRRSDLEKFFEYKDKNIFNPLRLSYEPFLTDEENDHYYPVIFVKNGNSARGGAPLTVPELKNELLRLKNVIEEEGYEISKVEYVSEG